MVIPVGGSLRGLAAAVSAYGEAIAALEQPFEILLVPGPAQVSACRELTEDRDWVGVHEPPHPGWGRAVRAGLVAANGGILCYTNWERTSAAALSEMLGFALATPELVFRANRRTRDTRRQRLGSLLFNLECRALLAVTAWDVNGTPKAFRREHAALLDLREDDDLLDAEFALVCEHAEYPVAEIPIEADPAPGQTSGPDYLAALRMYAGVLRLRRRLGAAPPPSHAQATP